jgi:hypothetical protein
MNIDFIMIYPTGWINDRLAVKAISQKIIRIAFVVVVMADPPLFPATQDQANRQRA